MKLQPLPGKFAGASLGAALCRSDAAIRKYLGLALIPQAGVSIGLAALAQRMLPPDLGTLLSTIILSSAVLYEMAGPACARASLFLAHAIPSREKPKKAPVQAVQEPQPAQAGEPHS